VCPSLAEINFITNMKLIGKSSVYESLITTGGPGSGRGWHQYLATKPVIRRDHTSNRHRQCHLCASHAHRDVSTYIDDVTRMRTEKNLIIPVRETHQTANSTVNLLLHFIMTFLLADSTNGRAYAIQCCVRRLSSIRNVLRLNGAS